MTGKIFYLNECGKTFKVQKIIGKYICDFDGTINIQIRSSKQVRLSILWKTKGLISFMHRNICYICI